MSKTLKDYPPSGFTAGAEFSFGAKASDPAASLGSQSGQGNSVGFSAVRGTQNSMQSGSDGAAHPWRVTSAGAASVAVGPGKVLGTIGESGSTFGPRYADYVSYAGGNVAISGAGWVYAVIETAESLVYSEAIVALAALIQSYTRYPTSVSVEFSTLSPGGLSGKPAGEIWIPIAEVNIISGVADATDQILTHNPIIQLGYTTTTA